MNSIRVRGFPLLIFKHTKRFVIKMRTGNDFPCLTKVKGCVPNSYAIGFDGITGVEKAMWHRKINNGMVIVCIFYLAFIFENINLKIRMGIVFTEHTKLSKQTFTKYNR